MRILVTGATGFLGTHLLPKLLQAGHHVRALARSAPQTPHPSLEVMRGSLEDRDLVRKAIAGVDAIYHLAGLVSFRPGDGRQMYRLHVDCTRMLLEELKASGQKVRFILASTSGTTAVSKDERLATEADDYPIAVVGRWPYYLSKIYQEKLCLDFCRQNGIPLVVLNPSLLLGPGDDRLSSTWTVLKFLNRELPAMPNGGLSFVDARDAADVFFAALNRGELYGKHLFGVNLSLSEFFHRLERLTGVSAPRLRLPSKVTVLGAKLLERVEKARGRKAPLDPMEVDVGEHYFYLDASKARSLLGFTPRDPQETLYDTVQYLFSKMPPKRLPGIKGELYEKRMAR